eukprot:Hpha_TRINITY_DN8777_c0_g1::TRINITY_DN8777_c0_g1_i1::g.45336::m.45336
MRRAVVALAARGRRLVSTVSEIPNLNGIQLRLEDASAAASSDAVVDGSTAPYWDYLWPGGWAVSRFLVQHPVYVQGKVVVDVGTGSGVAALTALRVGARAVVANDVEEAALEAVRRNAELNGMPWGGELPYIEPWYTGEKEAAVPDSGRVHSLLCDFTLLSGTPPCPLRRPEGWEGVTVTAGDIFYDEGGEVNCHT